MKTLDGNFKDEQPKRKKSILLRPNTLPLFVLLSSVGGGCSTLGGALPGLNTSSSVMMKPFLSFPVEAMSTVGLFSNFNMVRQCVCVCVCTAVYNHYHCWTYVTPVLQRRMTSDLCDPPADGPSAESRH